MKTKPILLALVLVFAAVGCKQSKKKDQQKTQENNQQTEQATENAQAKKTVYVAHLKPLNEKVTGSKTTGEARFVIADNMMTVTIEVQGAPANMEHWQHFHGFENGKMAQCATMADDKNGDGIIDVTETGPVSGTTMVPFNALPTAMKIGADTYPKANANGNYNYVAKIPMDKLNKVFAKTFDGQSIDLDHRVLYIHGVPNDTELPKSVASIADIPAQITIPIACGKIEKVQ